jgi:hypothetical protein
MKIVGTKTTNSALSLLIASSLLLFSLAPLAQNDAP